MKMEYLLCCCPVVASLSYYFYQKGQEIREKRAKEAEITRFVCKMGIKLMKFGTDLILDDAKRYQSRVNESTAWPPQPFHHSTDGNNSEEDDDAPEWDDIGCSLMDASTKSKNE